MALCVYEEEETLHWNASAEVACVTLDHARIASAAAELVPGGRFDMLPVIDGRAPRLAAMLHALHAEQATGYASGRLFVDGIELPPGISRASSTALPACRCANAESVLRSVIGPMHRQAPRHPADSPALMRQQRPPSHHHIIRIDHDCYRFNYQRRRSRLLRNSSGLLAERVQRNTGHAAGVERTQE